MQKSKMESEALKTLGQNDLDVFTTNDRKNLLYLKKSQVYNLVKSLKKKRAHGDDKAWHLCN